MTTWEKIKHRWVWYGCEIFNFHRFRSFRRGIYNLCIWLPTIWYDRQWDSSYLYRILQLKFKRMEQFYGSEWAVSADAPEMIHQCRICRILCERIIAEDYTTPYDDRNKPYHDQFILLFKKHLESEENSFSFNQDEKENKACLLEYTHEDMMLCQDIEYLCKMIQKYSQCWWD